MKTAEPNTTNANITQNQYLPEYGDLTLLNTDRTILDSVGQEELNSIVSDFMDLLQSSSAIYERNGDYALGIFSSVWCRNLDNISRGHCHTTDNEAALASGKWLCHESCWTSVSKMAIQRKEPVDKACYGGLRIYAVPIMIDGDCIGAINFGYGTPPGDRLEMKPIADRYNVSIDKLLELSKTVKRHDSETIELAKKRLHTSALLISKIVQTKQIEKKLLESERNLRNSQQIAHLGSWRLDLATNQVMWTEELYNMYGFDPALPPPPYTEHMKLFTPSSWERLSTSISNTRETGIPYELELETVRKDGSNGWMWVRGEAIKDSEGNPIGLWGAAQDITDRKQNEIEVEWLASFPQKNTNPIVEINSNGNVTYANPSARLLLSDIENKGFSNPFLTGLELEFNDKNERTFSREVKLNQKWYLQSLSYLPNSQHLRIYSLDITDRKQVEEKLQKSEAFLNSIINQSPNPMWISDESGTLIRINQACLSLLNLSKEEVLGKYNIFKDNIVEEQGYLQTVRNVYEKGEIARFEIVWDSSQLRHLKLTNFAFVVLDVSIFPVINGNGEITNAVIQHIDITRRKQVEQILAAEKERLAITLHSIGDGVITTDANGNIVILNKVAEKLTGWNSDAAIGRSLPEVFNIINEETRKPCENPVEKVLQTGHVVELANHTCLIAKSGREMVIADSVAPIFNFERNIIGVVLVFRDITEKQKINNAMQRSQKLESLGILAGGIAHDFNNLMGGIYGYIELAIGNTKENIVTSYLSEAMASIDRARGLTSQILTFAKGGAPVQEISPLFPFVEESVKFALSGANVSCNFDVPQDLWVCNFDKNQIGQVIDNLIINAQQAMPVGGAIKLTARNITLTEKEHSSLAMGNYVKITVKDCGTGIPQELISRIFDPFFTTKVKGRGLGLATCYSIINQHGGCIDVDSVPGKGSTFHVYLPASIDTVSSPTDKSMTIHKGSGTFLIMDDEEVMRETIGEKLKSFGYSVICKKNGKDAVEYFESEIKAKREIVGMIFDLTVPGEMGGKAVIKEIRKLDKEIPVFVASGYAEDPVMKSPNEYGFMASICKPFRKYELAVMLNKYMQPMK